MPDSTSRVLVTGFEPFGGGQSNPSALIAQALDGRLIAGRAVVGVVLPCVFGLAAKELRKHLGQVMPELVVCLGQAGGRAAIGVERVAINIDDARLADNAGAQPVDVPIARGGPVAYWSSLPIKAIVAALDQAGIAAEVSQTAGTFVCNHVFYALMRAIAGKPVRGGFIHVPFAPEQGEPSMPLAQMVQAIELAVVTATQARVDLRVAGGATH